MELSPGKNPSSFAKENTNGLLKRRKLSELNPFGELWGRFFLNDPQMWKSQRHITLIFSFPPVWWDPCLQSSKPGWVWEGTPMLLARCTFSPRLLRTQRQPTEPISPPSPTPGDQNHLEKLPNFWGRKRRPWERPWKINSLWNPCVHA